MRPQERASPLLAQVAFECATLRSDLTAIKHCCPHAGPVLFSPFEVPFGLQRIRFRGIRTLAAPPGHAGVLLTEFPHDVRSAPALVRPPLDPAPRRLWATGGAGLSPSVVASCSKKRCNASTLVHRHPPARMASSRTPRKPGLTQRMTVLLCSTRLCACEGCRSNLAHPREDMSFQSIISIGG